MHMPDPTFPPLLTGHVVSGRESAFAVACERAARGELGAGDVVWSRHVSRIEAAIVLEPEVGLETAAQTLLLAMVGLGDCLGALAPPQVGVTFIWPNVVCINGAPAGEIRAAAAANGDRATPPAWMALGLELRHRREPSDPEPGETPDITWLAEEGGEELTRTQIIESYSRHFLAWLNTWEDDGFRPVHDSWLYRAEQRDQEIELERGGLCYSGAFLGLDENGNLLLKDDGGKAVAVSLSDWFERVRAAKADT